MTQTDKDLLLKDLCARLPYGVRVEYKGKTHSSIYDVLGVAHGRLAICLPFMSYTEHPLVEEVKPYLFPMSSITEEQRVEAFTLLNNCDYYTIDNTIKWLDNHPIKFFDWCDKNHFDYRGLIPMGLAIDATGKNIY